MDNSEHINPSSILMEPLPPPSNQSQGLQYFLDDTQRSAIFKKFLKQKGHDTNVIYFWLACQGLKDFETSTREKIINIMYEKQVKKISAISLETKDAIGQKLSSGVGVNSSIFDAALREVVNYIAIKKSSFLKSELYRKYVDSLQSKDLSTNQELSLSKVQRKQEINAYSQHDIESIKKKNSTVENRLETLQRNSSILSQQNYASQPKYVLNKDYLPPLDSFVPLTQRLLPSSRKINGNSEQFRFLITKKVQKLQSNETTQGKEQTTKMSMTNELLSPSYPYRLEEDSQDILDNHLSTVSSLMGQTPTLSPTCPSPPITNAEEDRKSLEHSNVYINTAFPDTVSYKHRQDLDNISFDSGLIDEWINDDESVDYSNSLANQRRLLAKRLSSSSDSGVSMESLTLKNDRYRRTSFQDCHRPQDFCRSVGPLTDIRAKRQLKDKSRAKSNKQNLPSSGRTTGELPCGKLSSIACGSEDSGMSQWRQSKKPDSTVIGYTYSHDTMPFKSKLPGKNITLRQFKSLLNKQGNFRYFFKKVNDGNSVVFEEVSNDFEILPLWEGKIFGIIKNKEDTIVAKQRHDCG